MATLFDRIKLLVSKKHKRQYLTDGKMYKFLYKWALKADHKTNKK